MSHPKLTTGRLGRLARLAQVGARTGASLLLSKDGRGAAAQAAEVLGGLRGLAAKVGQMASYVDGMVPDEHRAAYETALGGLRSAAPQSPPAAVKRLIESEFDAPLGSLFAEFDDAPFASASIGQVHRALLGDGRAVAVKVQHPGIDVAVENDLANAGVIESLVGALGPRAMGTKAVFDEIAARFREELDYRIEAESQRAFQKMHDGDAFIRVPTVIATHSSRRVLTSELVSGRTLEEAAVHGAHEPLAVRLLLGALAPRRGRRLCRDRDAHHERGEPCLRTTAQIRADPITWLISWPGHFTPRPGQTCRGTSKPRERSPE